MKRATSKVLRGALFAAAFLPAVSAFAETVTVLNFASGSHNLTPEAQAALDQFVKKNGKLCINLAGFTDTRGSAAYNQALSERRVKATANYIKSLKFKKDITKLQAFGEAKLAVAREGDVAANRRVEVRSYKCGGAVFPVGAVPGGWLAAAPFVCLTGACDFSSSSSTTTTTTTTTATATAD